MKFKVGDKVKVVKVTTNPCKRKYIGETFTVKNLNPNGNNAYSECHYGVLEYGVPYVFLEDELEFAEFTKSDLTDGLVVEYRNGDRRMVLGNVFTSLDGFSEVKNYDENLINKLQSGFNIDRIYTSSACILDRYFDDEYLTLIWERPEEPAKKMTVAEIEKELGYKIEIVSEN